MYNSKSKSTTISDGCMTQYNDSWIRYQTRYSKSSAELTDVSKVVAYRAARYVLRIQMAIATIRRAELELAPTEQYIVLSLAALQALEDVLSIMKRIGKALGAYPTMCMRIIAQFSRRWPLLKTFIRTGTDAAAAAAGGY